MNDHAAVGHDRTKTMPIAQSFRTSQEEDRGLGPPLGAEFKRKAGQGQTEKTHHDDPVQQTVQDREPDINIRRDVFCRHYLGLLNFSWISLSNQRKEWP